MKKLIKPLILIFLFCFLIFLPLLGVMISGKDIKPFLQFPPLTQKVAHAPFSWIVTIIFSILLFISIMPFIIKIIRSKKEKYYIYNYTFPGWGWIGVILLITSWYISWSKYPIFIPIQRYIFTPLWLGYIIYINALTYRRTGFCLLIDNPKYLISLFFISAIFWWFFEYLNRYINNWYYVGITKFNSIEYIIFATLPFSTVLPAVMSTYKYL